MIFLKMIFRFFKDDFCRCKIFFSLVIFIFCPKIFSHNFDSVFNEKITKEEIALLNSCVVVIRNIDSTQDSCLKKNVAPKLEKIRLMLTFLNPNYLSEAMFSVPYELNEDFADQVEDIFLELETFKEIQYFPDDENGKSKKLFSVADEIISFQTSFGTITNARFKMPPFSRYNAKLELERDGNEFIFTHVNVTPLNAFGIRVINEYKMIAGLAVIKVDDRWLVYAVGALNAWKPDSLKSKLEKMFYDRIRDFAKFYVSKVNVKFAEE